MAASFPAWTGATVAVIGTGPSLTVEQIEQARQAGCQLVAIGKAIELAPDAYHHESPPPFPLSRYQPRDPRWDPWDGTLAWGPHAQGYSAIHLARISHR